MRGSHRASSMAASMIANSGASTARRFCFERNPFVLRVRNVTIPRRDEKCSTDSCELRISLGTTGRKARSPRRTHSYTCAHREICYDRAAVCMGFAIEWSGTAHTGTIFDANCSNEAEAACERRTIRAHARRRRRVVNVEHVV
jgi:hypothetical protein